MEGDYFLRRMVPMVDNPLAPSVTTRDRKGLKFLSIVGDAYNKARLSEEEAQRVNDTPGLAVLVAGFIAENRQSIRYAEEEVRSGYGYRSGYRKPVQISDQIDILRSHWPQLNPDGAIRYMKEVYLTLQLPDWVEGPFALIRPGFFSEKYGEELEEVFKALAKDLNGKFVNYHEGQLGSDHLRQSAKTISAMVLAMEQQPDSDILILGEQFGIRHRGRSVRRACEVIQGTPGEFGEGTKNVGTMLLTNPSRLQHLDDLWIDCAGDEYAPDAVGGFGSAPYFVSSSGRVGFSTGGVSHVDGFYGAASGWSPQ